MLLICLEWVLRSFACTEMSVACVYLTCSNTWGQVSKNKDWSNSLNSTPRSFQMLYQNGSKDETLNSEQDICSPLQLDHFSFVYLKEKRRETTESWSVFVGVLGFSIACFCLLPYTGLYQPHDHDPGLLDTIYFMENRVLRIVHHRGADVRPHPFLCIGCSFRFL